MIATFYSFKDKKDEPEPLVKLPGSIEGQTFDIGDCENCTMVIMDHTEQIQIDQVKNCKIFIGACASSIFIRNCDNCQFYTSCRQLRLREVTNTTFYIHSMSEVHIEYTNTVRFAPFNGGYPEQAEHLKAANLDPNHNLWYDIYDHNDPDRSGKNWSLLPESEYSEPWFPAGTPCDPALKRTKKGSTVKQTENQDSMQSFDLKKLVEDSALGGAKISTTLEQAAQSRQATPKKPVPHLPPVGTVGPDVPPPIPAATEVQAVVADVGEEEKIKTVLKLFGAFVAGEDLKAIVHKDFKMILANGKSVTIDDMMSSPPTVAQELWMVEKVCIDKEFAYATFYVSDGSQDIAVGEGVCNYTGILQKNSVSSFGWVLMHVQKSAMLPYSEAPTPYYG